MDNINSLIEVIKSRKESPMEGSYTNYLFEKGLDKILKKVGEECTEVVIAAKNNDNTELVNEICDLIYHVAVLVVEQGVEIEDIKEELEKRSKKIGNKKPERRKIENI